MLAYFSAPNIPHSATDRQEKSGELVNFMQIVCLDRPSLLKPPPSPYWCLKFLRAYIFVTAWRITLKLYTSRLEVVSGVEREFTSIDLHLYKMAGGLHV